jgi:hypothetical protein
MSGACGDLADTGFTYHFSSDEDVQLPAAPAPHIQKLVTCMATCVIVLCIRGIIELNFNEQMTGNFLGRQRTFHYAAEIGYTSWFQTEGERTYV